MTQAMKTAMPMHGHEASQSASIPTWKVWYAAALSAYVPGEDVSLLMTHKQVMGVVSLHMHPAAPGEACYVGDMHSPTTKEILGFLRVLAYTKRLSKWSEGWTGVLLDMLSYLHKEHNQLRAVLLCHQLHCGLNTDVKWYSAPAV
jgi:hypothetical protein